MILLVDGFNAIYKFPDLEEAMYRGQLEKAMRGLLQILLQFRERWKKPLTIHVFFDGKKKQGDETENEKVSGMFVYYSHDRSADHMIRQFIGSTLYPGDFRVISSDKEVVHFAKKHKCDVQSSEEFAKWVEETLSEKPPSAPEKEVNPDLSQEELRFWQEMFRNKKEK